jgi:hypothetical protein
LSSYDNCHDSCTCNKRILESATMFLETRSDSDVYAPCLSPVTDY